MTQQFRPEGSMINTATTLPYAFSKDSRALVRELDKTHPAPRAACAEVTGHSGNYCVGCAASARVWHGHSLVAGASCPGWTPDCRLARLIPHGGAQTRPAPGLQ
jgi:hypothetical protein